MDAIEALGYGAAALLVLSNAYTPFTWFRRFLQAIIGSANRQLGIVQSALLTLHCCGNVGATVLSLTHSGIPVARRPHNDVIAWIALALMLWLSLSGYIMRNKWFPSTSRRVARLLHVQYLLTGLLVASLGMHVLLIGD